MATAPFLDDETRYEYQYEVLWQTILNNPYLKSSAVPTLNKGLNTSEKQIIRAINSIYSDNNSNKTGLNNVTNFMNSMIGNPNIDSTISDDLHKVGENLSRAITKIYTELHGNLDTPISLPEGKTVAEILNSLNTISEQSFETIEPITQYQIVGLNSDGKIFVLDSNTLDHAEKFVGVAIESKVIGEQCKVKVFGEIANPSWTLEIGKTYFCGLNGNISTNAMNNTWTQRIGKAKDIHTIIINTGDCILL